MKTPELLHSLDDINSKESRSLRSTKERKNEKNSLIFAGKVEISLRGTAMPPFSTATTATSVTSVTSIFKR